LQTFSYNFFGENSKPSSTIFFGRKLQTF